MIFLQGGPKFEVTPLRRAVKTETETGYRMDINVLFWLTILVFTAR